MTRPNSGHRQRLEGPNLARTQEFRAEGLVSAEERRVRISFSSTQPYLRASWFDDPWMEVLGHDAGEVNLERLNAGAPVLYNHDRYDRDNRIGVVERAWIEDGRGLADIRLSRREAVAGLWQDLQDGVLRNVSVGYQIHERTLLTARDDAPDEYRVTSWTPLEISLVDIPADHTVGVGRSQESAGQFRIINLPDESGPHGDPVMPPETVKQEPGLPPADPVTHEEIRAQVKTQERQRRADIRNLCTPMQRRHPWIAELADKALDDDTQTAATVGQEILRKLAEMSPGPLQPDPAEVGIRAGEDARDKFIQGATQALLVRAATPGLSPEQRNLSGNEFRGLSLTDLARHCLGAQGVNVRGLDHRQIAGRAFTQTNSDFPILLENAMHKSMTAGYTTAALTWRRWCKQGSVVDFRAHHRYTRGLIGRIQARNEAGELRQGYLPDGEKQSLTASTKGLIIGLTREAIINDDMDLFGSIGPEMGAAAARTVEYDAFAKLTANPALSDGVALFHANHGNLAGSGALIGVDTLDAARVAMASQKDPSGQDYLDILPAVLVCPISKGAAARVVIGSEYDPDAVSKLQRPNAVRGMVGDIVDTARLSGTAWYLFADPNQHPVIEVAFLNGQDSPALESENGFTVDGVNWRVTLDYGVAAVGYRGAYKNAGA